MAQPSVPELSLTHQQLGALHKEGLGSPPCQGSAMLIRVMTVGPTQTEGLTQGFWGPEGTMLLGPKRYLLYKDISLRSENATFIHKAYA